MTQRKSEGAVGGGGPGGGGGSDEGIDEPVRFVDVDDGGVHSGSIGALAAAGVTAGCGVGPLRYCPDEVVTRAQMATFLVRALGLDQALSAGLTDPDPGGVHARRVDSSPTAGIAAS